MHFFTLAGFEGTVRGQIPEEIWVRREKVGFREMYELRDRQQSFTLGIFFDSIEDESDAPSQKPSAKDWWPEFDQLDFPYWFFRQHQIADPALNHDDGERH